MLIFAVWLSQIAISGIKGCAKNVSPKDENISVLVDRSCKTFRVFQTSQNIDLCFCVFYFGVGVASYQILIN